MRWLCAVLIAGCAVEEADPSGDAPDATIASDASEIADGGAIDAELSIDAEAPLDAGAPVDAGAPLDAEVSKDAGVPEMDAGTITGMVEGCTAVSNTDYECTLRHDGLDREYLLHVPRGFTGGALVFNFHGLASSPQQQRDISLMIAKSDAEGFIVVHPQGTGTLASWNAGFCCSSAASNNVDDVGFTLAMIERIAAGFAIDRGRIYATGLSNGGHMAYRLACEQSEVFAAIAPVAAVVALVPCTPSRAVPVLHFHGTADAIVGYNTGSSTGGTSAPETVAGWADRNGCSEETDVSYQMGEVTCEAHRDCPSGSWAELCTIQNGGHTWPGGDNPFWLGHTTQDISATEYIWSFFVAHAR